MSQPAAVSWAICCSVAFTSEVSVVAIDCTDTRASPPTRTEPTLIWRDLRRGARTGGGEAGMPSEIAICRLSDVDGFDDVGVQGEQGDQDQHGRHGVHHRQHL